MMQAMLSTGHESGHLWQCRASSWLAGVERGESEHVNDETIWKSSVISLAFLSVRSLSMFNNAGTETTTTSKAASPPVLGLRSSLERLRSLNPLVPKPPTQNIGDSKAPILIFIGE